MPTWGAASVLCCGVPGLCCGVLPLCCGVPGLGLCCALTEALAHAEVGVDHILLLRPCMHARPASHACI